MFWVRRKRRMESAPESTMKAAITIPWMRMSRVPMLVGNTKPKKESTIVPVATITSTPGHHAQKPAKKPQKLPKALLVHR